MSLADVVTGLGEALQAISGLRVVPFTADVHPPEAVVDLPTSVDFDSTFARGTDTYAMKIRVYVSRADDRSGRIKLASFFPGGASDVKAAVESDPKLGGAAKTVRVTGAENVGYFDVAGVSYLGCDFIVDVMA